MSLIIKIDTCEESNSFLVFDKTGNYNGDNKGGYGSPNYSADKIIESYIEVQGPSDTEIFPYKIAVTGSLPNKECLGYEILPIQIGQTNAELESGKYKVKLTHVFQLKSGGTKTLTGSTVNVFINNISCCINKLPKLNKDMWKDPKQKAIAELNLLFEGVVYDKDCGLYDQANTTIEYLKGQCKCTGCH